MRVTGSGDVREKVKDTMPGKLPQRKISTTAAQGYSSYGNQIGLATGMVREIYDEGYKAKRMEIGAVIGAAPFENVIREIPARVTWLYCWAGVPDGTAAAALPVQAKRIQLKAWKPAVRKYKRGIRRKNVKFKDCSATKK